jgi:hypothetical protein
MLVGLFLALNLDFDRVRIECGGLKSHDFGLLRA